MSKTIDLTGKRFGRLVVMKRVKNSKSGRARWLCQCDCGNQKEIVGTNLTFCGTKSCGCILKEKKTEEKTIHGETGIRLYKIWLNMKNRCYNSKTQSFQYYGGKNIKVCKEWKNNYTEFRNWALQNGYNNDLSIDRVDVKGDYTPDNCRWVSMKAQQNNRSNNHIITCRGITKTLKQWCEVTGLNYSTVSMRLLKGWEVENALFTPVYKRKEEYYDRKKLTIC